MGYDDNNTATVVNLTRDQVAGMLRAEQARDARLDIAIMKAECLLQERRRRLELLALESTGLVLVR